MEFIEQWFAHKTKYRYDGSYGEQKSKVREEQHDFELWLQCYSLHSQCVS